MGLRFNTSADVLNAAVDDLRSGRLVCLFDAVVPEEAAYYVVYAERVAFLAKVSAFWDWLFREFAGA